MTTNLGCSKNSSLDNLTPDQRRQLRHLLATKVMGWTAADDDYAWVTPDGTKVLFHEWCPDEDPAAALEVLSRYDDWWIGYHEGEGYLCNIGAWEVERSTLPLAICAAVMAAEGLEVPDA